MVWSDSDLVLLVSSCDKYAACWDPFAYGLQKYWPNHPKLVTITNFLNVNYGESLQVGEDRGWALNLMTALDQLHAPFILYAQEDYWLSRAVSDTEILDYLNLLKQENIAAVRLFPAPKPGGAVLVQDRRLSWIPKGAEYRASLQMTLWKSSILRGLLRENESPWVFESAGSRRSDALDEGFGCVNSKHEGMQYTFTAIVDGMWSPVAYAYARNEGISVNFDGLPKKSPVTRLRIAVRNILYKIKKKFMRAWTTRKMG